MTNTPKKESCSDLLNFFLHLGQAKRTYRTGWVLRDVKEAESIADHMYRMAVMSFLAPENVDKNKCIQMSLIHDLAECIVGDLAPADNVSKDEKKCREKAAILSLTRMLDPSNGSHLLSLFNEYEEHNSSEAKFVKSLDLFDMYLQAYEYELLNGNKLDLSEFFSKIPNYLLDDSNENENIMIKKCLKELLEVRNKNLDCLPPDSNLNTVLKLRLHKTD